MANIFALLMLLAKLLALRCQENEIHERESQEQYNIQGNPSYSFSYGVSDARTGDIKTVWESKDGDTVKGHYSVLEPGGSMRTVEYSAGPKTGFTAVVKNDDNEPQQEAAGRSLMEEKSLRDYDKYYDFSEDDDVELYSPKQRKRQPLEDVEYQSYGHRHRPKYELDLEPSDYTHSITIAHPYDQSASESEAYSHIGVDFDPNCKTKKEEQNKLFTNIADFNLGKRKYPIKTTLSPKDNDEDFEKYMNPPEFDIEKHVNRYKTKNKHKTSKFSEDHIKAATTKFKDESLPFESERYPFFPDVSLPENHYSNNYRPRLKNKQKPYKIPEYHSTEDLDDYILVPKKKYKSPTRNVKTPDEFAPDVNGEFHRPHFSNDFDEINRPYYSSSIRDNLEDDRPYHPSSDHGTKEVIRKVVKKRKPALNLLDILDI